MNDLRWISRLLVTAGAMTLISSCGGDGGSVDSSDGSQATGSSGDGSDSGASNSAGSGGGEPSGDDSSSAGGNSSVGDDDEAKDTSGASGGEDGSGSETELPQCSAENQEQSRGSNEDCYSPFYNTEWRENSDVLGCDCNPCDNTETCIDGIQYFCANTWYDKEVSSCDGPNACVEVWLKTFQSEEMADCERLAGGLLVGDAELDDPVVCRIELSFTNYLKESRGIAGGRTGEYRCNGMQIIGTFGPSEFTGSYDPATNVLTWDGMEMQEIAGAN